MVSVNLLIQWACYWNIDFQNEEFYLCIYAQRDCDVILFHHEGGVEIGDVDSKVRVAFWENKERIAISTVWKKLMWSHLLL